MVAFAINGHPNMKCSFEITLDNILAIRLCMQRLQDTKRGIWRAPGLDTMASERISYSNPKTPIHVIQGPIQEKRSRFCKCSMSPTFLTLENIATAPLIASGGLHPVNPEDHRPSLVTS